MASSSDTTNGFSFSDGGSSLFDGMVLIDPFSSGPIQTQQEDPETLPQPSSPSPSSSSVATSQPLDEDLFSDLTLLSPAADPPVREETVGLAAEISRRSSAPSRQASRKKKRGVRIGYARETVPEINSASASTKVVVEKELNFVRPPSPAQAAGITELIGEVPEVEDRKQHVQYPPEGGRDTSRSQTEVVGVADAECKAKSLTGDSAAAAELPVEQEEKGLAIAEATEKDDAFSIAERKLELIRARIAHRLKQIQETALSASAERKESGKRRRKAAEEVSTASVRYKELERQLEEACETEDFERAEMLSEMLASVEKEKKELLDGLSKAEAECDSIESMMHEVLERRIEAEEEARRLLEQFAEDSADNADLVLKNAKDISLKEMEEWEVFSEELESKKMEMDVEIHIIGEARSGLQNSIHQLVQEDIKEKERLCIRRDVLTKELDELLVLVRHKEAEIAENNCQLQEVVKRISSVEDEFQESRSNIDKKYNDLQSVLKKMESDVTTLSLKKDVNENQKSAERMTSRLRELACVSTMEARTCNDSIVLRKSLASPILKSREEKLKLTRTEEGITEEIQILRQQILAARSSLQELSFNRSRIQEEIAAMKQRISFIDKRGPELEAEKRVAAAARNFKEAGRMAAETKALSTEKENIQNKMTGAISDLDDMEGKINGTLNDIEKNEGLVIMKEKEAGRARFVKLHLDARAARAESLAAITLGDREEGDVSLQEAEAAESKAADLQQAYDFGTEDLANAVKDHLSIALIINLEGETLVDVAQSLNPIKVDIS